MFHFKRLVLVIEHTLLEIHNLELVDLEDALLELSLSVVFCKVLVRGFTVRIQFKCSALLSLG